MEDALEDEAEDEDEGAADEEEAATDDEAEAEEDSWATAPAAAMRASAMGARENFILKTRGEEEKKVRWV